MPQAPAMTTAVELVTRRVFDGSSRNKKANGSQTRGGLAGGLSGISKWKSLGRYHSFRVQVNNRLRITIPNDFLLGLYFSLLCSARAWVFSIRSGPFLVLYLPHLICIPLCLSFPISACSVCSDTFCLRRAFVFTFNLLFAPLSDLAKSSPSTDT